MPHVDVESSLLAPDRSPVRIHYRTIDGHRPIVFLHGGWGYEIYPFDRQIAALAPQFRIVIPDRTGYGQSSRIETLPADFHHRAAQETLAVIAALGLARPVLWGHSDGAIIALLVALAAPEKIAGVVAEATHFYRRKPSSRRFFDDVRANPRSLSASVTSVLARDHGESWPRVLELNADAWRRIADGAASSTHDLYDGRLGEIATPVLLLHGARDPRTEPGELDAMRHALGAASTTEVAVLPDGAHSPHSEAASADEATRAAQSFLWSV